MSLEDEMPFEAPPPVCPNVMQELEQYLSCPEKLPIYNFKQSHRFWDREPQLASLKTFTTCELASTLRVERDPKSGELVGFKEELIAEFETDKSCDIPVNFETDLLTTPPGLPCGYGFEVDKHFPEIRKKNVVNLINILHVEDPLGLTIEEKKIEPIKVEKPEKIIPNVEIDASEQEEVIPNESSIPVLKISEAPTLKVLKKAEWAEELEVKPVPDFHKRVPKMAYEWDFPLDAFQQLAIVKLEEDSNVFVAAHTSAGKTVVAEYAIALSLQRCTRAIYTSPIKALSNQKYRDFKKSFAKMGEVGLITGDIQMNAKAPCLIMTTEILRSMLYNKSEVVHDLEFVIFDEVHYINDPDRGHVWEEVMMLLQNHVKIVMLSATVPNAIEFANWVGQSKGKKVYLICTQKRPVPLHFYLYTGTGPQNTDNLFCIREAEGPWKSEEFRLAEKSKEPPPPVPVRGGYRGRGAVRQKYQKPSGIMSFKQEQTMWRSFLYYLKNKDKLPVVIFVLSRKRCDETADMLGNLNLVDNNDVNFINNFFKTSIEHLKEEDRHLPQVIRMGQLLSMGIGVHHSGILPILKEIVEMLFQKGKVLVLLATETFAMGINMPTKTVVFESIRKFDGTDRRNLAPAEFIQMAGRAGRRGIDKIGTVIIMCKGKFPKEHELKDMMLKKPSSLESQFKLTYATILKNLLRTNEASNPIERMMSSSFKEFSEQSKHAKCREVLTDVIGKLTLLKMEEDGRSYVTDIGMLESFFDVALEYITLRNEVQEHIFGMQKVCREIHPGRYVLISWGTYSKRLGLIVHVERGKQTMDRNKQCFNVLVWVRQSELSNVRCACEEPKAYFCRCELHYRMMDLIQWTERFVPDISCLPRLLKAEPHHILEVTDMTDNDFNYDVILKDMKQSFCHFKEPKLFPDTIHALTALREKSFHVGLNNFINLTKKINQPHFMNKCIRHKELKEKLLGFRKNSFPNFDDEFKKVFKRKALENVRDTLNREVTEFSMTQALKSKLQILEELKYLDGSDNVELKGKGAIRVPRNELMVTELIFRNILSEFRPPEIAALLSCLVFQAKTNIEMSEIERQIPIPLRKGKKMIEEINCELQMLERKYMPLDADVREFGELHFGLIHVVHDWASGKQFSETIQMTDVQEGIIVRCIQQLNEVLNCVKDVAQTLGDLTLKSKMEEASNAIKRDIVFAASLYLQ